MEELVKRHKQEKKDLQANIQKLKQIVPKNDKKRRKELNQKIEDMEAELNLKQKQELDQFKGDDGSKKEETVLEKLDQLQLNLESNQMNFKNEDNQKMTKAQKRREKKEREEKEKEKRIEEDEKNKDSHVRIIEINKLDKIFKEHNFKLHEIPSDGDCMYNAVIHQLNLQDFNDYDLASLRKLTADTLRKNKDHYLPFLTSSESDDLMSDKEFDEYCRDVESSRKWGGNIELQIISKELNVNIHVYQADGPTIVFDSNNAVLKHPLQISFHKYAYQLGAHYNSLIKSN